MSSSPEYLQSSDMSDMLEALAIHLEDLVAAF